ncbi:MAG: hypothetical protein ACJ790_11185 [Myxococcaceae bacterium]
MTLRRLVVLCAALCSAQAFAGGLYLNDVKVGSVDVSGIDATGLKFDNAKIRFDEKGNLFIDVKGYSIKVEGGGKNTASSTGTQTDDSGGPARLTRRYFLVTEQSVPGMTEYDVDVYINSKWIRKLRNNEEQIVTEITKYLQPGKNTVLMTAKKVAVGDRKSYSADHVFRVIIGEGNVGGDNVMIDNPVVTFKRTAADTGDVSQEFTFTTR